jgi:hypothetical protein
MQRSIQHRTRRVALATAAGLAALATGGVADAGPPHHEEHVTVIDEETEVCGLDVRVRGEIRERVLWNVHEAGGPWYFAVRVHGSVSWTSIETGRSFTNIWTLNDKDLDITDNGDGTLTILVLATGSDRYLDADGKLLFANPGQVRYEILVDHAGTPSDPTDDVFLEDLGLVKGSTGRNDTEGRDFCDDLNMVIGP